MDLVLLETAEAVEQWQQRADRPAADLVALSPWAEERLDALGVPYDRPEDHYEIAEREDSGQASLASLEAWCRETDDWILDRFPRLREPPGFRPCYTAFFWLKIMQDAAWVREFELRRLLEHRSPNSVYYFSTLDASDPSDLTFMDESVYSRLLPDVAASLRIQPILVGALEWPSPPIGRHKSKLEASHEIATLGAAMASSWMPPWRHRHGRICLLDRYFTTEAELLAHFSVLWWRTSAEQIIPLTRLGPPVSVPRSDPDHVADLLRSLTAAWADLRRRRQFREHFIRPQIDLFPILESRIRRLLLTTVPDVYQQYRTAIKQLVDLKIDAVFATNLAEPRLRAVAMAARAVDVPVIVADHGSMGYFDFPLDRHTDSALADFRFVWGEGVRQTVDERYPNAARPIAVGGVPLDHARRRIRPNAGPGKRRQLASRFGLDPTKQTIMFAPTLLANNNRYISQLIGSDSELYRRQRRLVDLVAGFPNAQLLIKLHPSTSYPLSPIVAYLQRHPAANVRCTVGGLLTDAMAVSDLLVTDSPTTTLLEMLLTDRPILVCHNGVMEFEAGALELMRRRVHFAWSIEELELVLRRHLSGNGEPTLLDPSNSFLTAFGTHRNDGRSAHRAALELSRIVSEWHPRRGSRLDNQDLNGRP